MQIHLRRLSGDVVIYGAGRMILQLFGFVALPVLTRIFSPTDYGIVESIAAFTAVIALFASLGLESASQRSYFDYRPDQTAERRVVLSTAFWTLSGWSVILAATVAAFAGWIAGPLLGSQAQVGLIVIAVLLIPLTMTLNFFQEILRLRHQPGRYSLLSVLSGGLGIGLSLYFVAVAHWGLLGNYIGPLIGILSALAVGYVFVRQTLDWRFDRRELRVMLAYGLPLVPVAASTWVLQLADRFFLVAYAPRAELGLYGLGVRLSNLLLLGVTAFGIAWSPFILELYNRNPAEERQVRARAFLYMTLVLSFGAVGLAVFAREFFLTVTAPTFVDAYKVVGLLVVGLVITGINGVTITGISLARQTHYFARYTVVAAILNTVLNFLLIPGWGMIGAALATTLTYAALGILYYRRAQSLQPAPYDIRRFLIITTIAGVLILVGTFITVEPLWAAVALKLPLVLSYPLLVILCGGLEPEALAFLRTSFRRAVHRPG